MSINAQIDIEVVAKIKFVKEFPNRIKNNFYTVKINDDEYLNCKIRVCKYKKYPSKLFFYIYLMK